MSRVMDVLANRELYSVEPHLTAAEVAHRMAELRVGAILVIKNGELKGIFSERDLRVHNCRHLPVMRDGGVTGFLSMRDLMNFALEQKTEELHHMRAYISSGA